MSSRDELHTAREEIVLTTRSELGEARPRHCRFGKDPMIATIGEGQKVVAEGNSERRGSSSVAGLCRRESAVRTVVWKVPSSSMYGTPPPSLILELDDGASVASN